MQNIKNKKIIGSLSLDYFKRWEIKQHKIQREAFIANTQVFCAVFGSADDNLRLKFRFIPIYIFLKVIELIFGGGDGFI